MEAVHKRCSEKKVFLQILQNSQEKTCGRVSCFNKVAGLRPQACDFIKKETLASDFIKKETLAQVFSCEFSEISKNTFFTEHFRTTASQQAIDNSPKCVIRNDSVKVLENSQEIILRKKGS